MIRLDGYITLSWIEQTWKNTMFLCSYCYFGLRIEPPGVKLDFTGTAVLAMVPEDGIVADADSLGSNVKNIFSLSLIWRTIANWIVFPDLSTDCKQANLLGTIRFS